MNAPEIAKKARRLERAARQIAEIAEEGDALMLEQIRGDVSFRALGAELELLLWTGAEWAGGKRPIDPRARSASEISEADLIAGYRNSGKETIE